MTLTDIMPTLRMSIPDPIDLCRWPHDTTVTVDDVVVQSLSLTRVADLMGTPMRWSLDHAGAPAVLICTVSAAFDAATGPVLLVDTDPRVSDTGVVEMCWHQARLIGRISVARRHQFEILGDGSHPPRSPQATTGPVPTGVDRVVVDLPRDLTVGDRLVVPGVVVTTNRSAPTVSDTPRAPVTI